MCYGEESNEQNGNDKKRQNFFYFEPVRRDFILFMLFAAHLVKMNLGYIVYAINHERMCERL